MGGDAEALMVAHSQLPSRYAGQPMKLLTTCESAVAGAILGGHEADVNLDDQPGQLMCAIVRLGSRPLYERNSPKRLRSRQSGSVSGGVHFVREKAPASRRQRRGLRSLSHAKSGLDQREAPVNPALSGRRCHALKSGQYQRAFRSPTSAAPRS
jgi:hypothetical protein